MQWEKNSTQMPFFTCGKMLVCTEIIIIFQEMMISLDFVKLTLTKRPNVFLNPCKYYIFIFYRICYYYVLKH